MEKVDLVILGAGPAGTSAGVYAARKKIKTILVTKEYGGQSVESMGIENWIGDVKIKGTDLAKKFKEHLQANISDTFNVLEEEVVNIKKENGLFLIKTENKEIEAKNILVALGSNRRKLPIESADKFENKGVTYCASCDGPLFTGKDVLVVGGGNAAFETALQLLAYTNSVTLIQRSSKFVADEITVKKALEDKKMTAHTNAELVELRGDKFVDEAVLVVDGEERIIKIGGVFAEIGLIPNTSLLEGLVKMDEQKRIVVDPKTGQTNDKNIWAAGDCTDVLFHQNNIASGDAVKALEHIYISFKRN